MYSLGEYMPKSQKYERGTVVTVLNTGLTPSYHVKHGGSAGQYVKYTLRTKIVGFLIASFIVLFLIWVYTSWVFY